MKKTRLNSCIHCDTLFTDVDYNNHANETNSCLACTQDAANLVITPYNTHWAKCIHKQTDIRTTPHKVTKLWLIRESQSIAITGEDAKVISYLELDQITTMMLNHL